MLSAVLLSVLGTVGEWISGHVLSALWPRVLGLWARLPLATEKRHRAATVEGLREMPFIYRDVKLDILEDFVATQMKPLGSDHGTAPFSLSENLRAKSRVIFLGNAGVGKTTFIRHTVVDLEAGGASIRYFGSERNLLPIYVPLKAVDDSGEFPILRYVRENLAYFKGSSGTRRLMELAENRRLFLMLDGYDEISFAGRDSHVRNELSILLGPDDALQMTLLAAEHPRRILNHVRKNRVWLTSRPDFFLANMPDRLIPDRGQGRGLDAFGHSVAILQVEGLGPRRAELVRRIFARYKDLQAALDAEAFIGEIDLSDDEEIKSLSYNPLFLTVMCYVYAHNTYAQRQDEPVLWGRFDEIVRACIRLLVVDLDEGKARGMPEGDRKVLLQRRNEFAAEKEEFLEYFAGKLFLDNRKIFPQSYLRDVAIEFFANSAYPTRAQIVAEMKQRKRDDLAGQLIAAGVFIAVDRTTAEPGYDFPHRRFHEVLARAYFESADRYRILLDHVGEPQWQELVLFIFPKTSHAEAIVRRLFELAIRKPDEPYYGRLIERCAVLRRGDLAIVELLKSFFEERQADGKPFKLPESLLDALRSDAEWQAELVFRFTRALLAEHDPGFRLLCELVSRLNQRVFTDAVAGFWNAPRATMDAASRHLLMKLTMRFIPNAIPSALPSLRTDAEALDYLGYFFVKFRPSEHTLLKQVYDALQEPYARGFLLRIEREAPPLYRMLRPKGAEQGKAKRKGAEGARSPEAIALPELSGTPLAAEWFDTASSAS